MSKLSIENNIWRGYNENGVQTLYEISRQIKVVTKASQNLQYKL